MELCIVLGAAALACLPLIARKTSRAIALAAMLLAATALTAAALRGHERTHDTEGAERATHLPRTVADGGYVSSDACRACHPAQYATWHETSHRTMTQPASRDAILASFDDVQLTANGQAYRLRRTGDDFWVDVGGSQTDRRQVVMVTGSHHQQRYWLRGAGGNSLPPFPFAHPIGRGPRGAGRGALPVP